MSSGFKFLEVLDHNNDLHNYKATEEDNITRYNVAQQTLEYAIYDFEAIRNHKLPITFEATYTASIKKLTKLVNRSYKNNFIGRLVEGVIRNLSKPLASNPKYYTLPQYNEMNKIAKGGFGTVFMLGGDNEFPIIMKNQPVNYRNKGINVPEFFQEVYNSLNINILRDENLTPNFYYFLDYHLETDKISSITDIPLESYVAELALNYDNEEYINSLELSSSMIYEKINGLPLSYIVNHIDDINFMSIMLQIITSLQLARKRLNFNHSDLHGGNVLISQLEKPGQIQYNSYDNDNKIYINANFMVSIIDFGFGTVNNMTNLVQSARNAFDPNRYGISYDIFYLLLSLIDTNARNFDSYQKLISYFMPDWDIILQFSDFDYRRYRFPENFYLRKNLTHPDGEYKDLIQYLTQVYPSLRIVIGTKEFHDMEIINCNTDCYKNLKLELYDENILNNNLYYYWLMNNSDILSKNADNYNINQDLLHYYELSYKNYKTEYNYLDLILRIIREIYLHNSLSNFDIEEYRQTYDRVNKRIRAVLVNENTTLALNIYENNIELYNKLLN